MAGDSGVEEWTGDATSTGRQHTRDLRRHARDSDARYHEAYRRGAAGLAQPVSDDPIELEAWRSGVAESSYQQGRSDQRHTASRPSGGGSRSTVSGPGWSSPPQVTSVAHQGASFMLGLVGYALVINYVRYGPAGVKAWLEAKFLNAGATTSATTSGPSATLEATPAQPAAAASSISTATIEAHLPPGAAGSAMGGPQVLA